MDSTVRAARDAVLERGELMPPAAVEDSTAAVLDSTVAVGIQSGNRSRPRFGRCRQVRRWLRWTYWRGDRKDSGPFGGAGRSSVSHGATSGGQSFGGGHAAGGGGHSGGGGHGGGRRSPSITAVDRVSTKGGPPRASLFCARRMSSACSYANFVPSPAALTASGIALRRYGFLLTFGSGMPYDGILCPIPTSLFYTSALIPVFCDAATDVSERVCRGSSGCHNGWVLGREIARDEKTDSRLLAGGIACNSVWPTTGLGVPQPHREDRMLFSPAWTRSCSAPSQSWAS